ncbi:MAG: hypothetical protein ACPGRD_11495, partial [Planktomarina sp.]
MKRVLLCIFSICCADVAIGQTLSTRGRIALFENQTAVLDNRGAQQYNNSVRLQPEPVIIPGTPGAFKPYT